MVKICQKGLLKINFEIIPKKRIFRFLPKISAGHGWSWKFFFASFQILGPLGCQGWAVIPQNVKKVKITTPYCILITVPYNLQNPSLLNHRVPMLTAADTLINFTWQIMPKNFFRQNRMTGTTSVVFSLSYTNLLVNQCWGCARFWASRIRIH